MIAMMPIPEVVAIASVVVVVVAEEDEEEEEDVTDSPVEAVHRTAGCMCRSVAE